MKLTTSKLRFVCAFPSVIKPLRGLTGLVAALWIFMGMDVMADNEPDWVLSSNQSSVPHTITIVGTPYEYVYSEIDGLTRPPWQVTWEVYSDTDLTSDGSYTLDSGYYVSMDDSMGWGYCMVSSRGIRLDGGRLDGGRLDGGRLDGGGGAPIHIL